MNADAILDIRNALARTFNEALKTHGPALAMAGAACFAAGAVHHAEHLADEPNLNQHCDDQLRFIDHPPSGLA